MSDFTYCRRTMLIGAVLVAGCKAQTARSRDTLPAANAAVSLSPCDAPELRSTVAQLGSRLKLVSLLAPDSSVANQIRQQYGPLVTPELLAAWTATPSAAPGRDVSSPWPERITVDSVVDAGGGRCRVHAAIVYVTSTDTVAARTPILLDLVEQDGWRVSAMP